MYLYVLFLNYPTVMYQTKEVFNETTHITQISVKNEPSKPNLTKSSMPLLGAAAPLSPSRAREAKNCPCLWLIIKSQLQAINI